MPKPLLSQADWYASLPAVYVSAAMLITDPAGRVLIVKPNYRPYWGVPGGIVEAGEAPHDGAAREIAEELGLRITAGGLLVVDWLPPEDARPRAITSYLFDGGTLAGLADVRLQEEERKRISRELHDEVGQLLTGLRMELRALSRLHGASREQFVTRLDETKILLDRTVQAVRDLAMGLRPAMLDDLGLVPALQWQAREFERRHDIRVSMNLDSSLDMLPDSYRTTIFRIVQEALTNCAKHAKATSVEISLQNQGGLVCLSIADDGVGLVRPTGRAGLGLVGIQERIRELGGWFAARNREGGGTVLTAEIPSEVPVVGHA